MKLNSELERKDLIIINDFIFFFFKSNLAEKSVGGWWEGVGILGYRKFRVFKKE